MVFLIHQTLCEGSIFSTVAPGPPLRPGHLFISLPTRVSAGPRVAVPSRQEVHEHGRPTAPPPHGHTLSPEGSAGPLAAPAVGSLTHQATGGHLFPAKGSDCPIDCVCAHTCVPGERVFTLPGRLTRTTWHGQGRVPMARGAVFTEGGTDTPRGWHSCGRSGSFPWLLRARALAPSACVRSMNMPLPSAAPLHPTSPGLLLISGSRECGHQEPPCSAPQGTGEHLQGPGTASQLQLQR